MIEQKNVFSVGQVNEFIKFLIEDSPILDSIYVTGEISNFKPGSIGGHLYFSLKDETGILRSVMFRSAASKLKFRPENGMRVLAHGRISVYPRDGQYQLYIDAMEPDGLGALAAAYEQLKNQLAAEGLFDDAKKKPLPKFPSVIGVITSPSGAAVRDIINILGRRCPQVKMILFPTLVQGESAPRQLCSGIRYFNTQCPADVIIIGRGGGSLEELWAFNDETLARTIAASQIPVISAVGHETDYTICDFVADRRAPTPSAAAEIAVPDSTELHSRVSAWSAALQSNMMHKLQTTRQTIDALAEKRVLSAPDSFLEQRQQQLDTLSAQLLYQAARQFSAARQRTLETEQRLHTLTERRLSAAQAVFHTTAARLDALNPLSVISRGYSAVFDITGKTVRSVDALHLGDIVKMKLSDGEAEAAVTALTKTEKGPAHG